MSSDPTHQQQLITAQLIPTQLDAALRALHAAPHPEDARHALEALYQDAATRAGLDQPTAAQAAQLRATLVIHQEELDRHLLRLTGAPDTLIRRQPGLAS